MIAATVAATKKIVSRQGMDPRRQAGRRESSLKTPNSQKKTNSQQWELDKEKLGIGSFQAKRLRENQRPTDRKIAAANATMTRMRMAATANAAVGYLSAR